ncbi:MAG: endonuclease/exonuclease/phosphatase family protein [Saprospiraceae bacterium]|nr:endonuclease/exonuclease/phosphatase family protein [Saprospiraceae bacterium]
MITRTLDYPPLKFLIAALIVLGATICIYTPNYYLLKMGARFAGVIMFGYLLLGMIFLILRQQGLMITSLICCAGLALFLKNASYADLKHAAMTSSETLKVSHYNVSSISDPAVAIDEILASGADIVSLQEVTPDWEYLLQETLGSKYPHKRSVVRFDPFGLALFSKHPITTLDTFTVGDVPNLVGIIKMTESEQEIQIIAAHTSPPLFSTAYSTMQDQVRSIGEKAQAATLPCLVVGNFNAPPWWQEIQSLRETGNLKDSRRSATFGLTEIFQSPGDYILHSPQLKCVDFQNVYSPDNSQLGISGTYQIKWEDLQDEEILQ